MMSRDANDFGSVIDRCRKKRAASAASGPKSREETPKEGGGNARARYRTAKICHRVAQNARGVAKFVVRLAIGK